MKKRHLLCSFMTLVLCLSLISGATFALFTSESKVNIAVTSGKVSVDANVQNLVLFSMDEEVAPTFANGGTAKYENGILTLDKVTPGDKVEFEIKVSNSSNVDINYRLKWKVVGKLGEVLVAKANDKDLEDLPWTKWEANATIKEVIIKVVVELPVSVGNDYQEQTCDIVFVVEAVQGNVTLSDLDNANNSEFVDNYDDLFYSGIASENVVVQENITSNSTYNLYFGPGDVTNLDLNGKIITLENVNQYGLTSSDGGKLVLDGNGTVNCGKGFFASSNNAQIIVNSGTYNMTVSSAIDGKQTHSIVQNNASIVINDGTFTSNVNDAAIFHVTANSKLEIKGGFFENTVDETPDYLNIGTNKYNTNRIIITGGTFVNWNPLSDKMCYTGEWPAAGEAAFGGPWILIPGDYKVVSEVQSNGDIWYTVVAK